MLRQRRLEFFEQKFRISRWKAASREPREQFLLASDVSLTLNDMVIHHPEVGRCIGHG